MNLFKSPEKVKAQKVEEVRNLLVPGEKLEHLYDSVLDYAAITSHRLLYVDRPKQDILKTLAVGIPFKNITSVCLKRGGLMLFTKTVTIHVGNRDIDIDFYSTEDALSLFKNLSSKQLDTI